MPVFDPATKCTTTTLAGHDVKALCVALLEHYQVCVWGESTKRRRYSTVFIHEGQLKRSLAVVYGIAPHATVRSNEPTAFPIGRGGPPMEPDNSHLHTCEQGLRKEERHHFASGSSSGPQPRHPKRSLLPARRCIRNTQREMKSSRCSQLKCFVGAIMF